MSINYGLGLICGIAISIVVMVLIWRLVFKDWRKPVYDERQRLEQGEAAKIGFYSLMILNIIHAIAEEFLGLNIGTYVGVFASTIIAVGIYAAVCIWKEAYFPINQSSRRWITGLFILGIMNVFCGINNKPNYIHDFGFNINYMCAILMFAITIVSLIKLKLINKVSSDEEDEDEESEA